MRRIGSPPDPTDATDLSEKTSAIDDAALRDIAAEWRRRFKAGDYYGAHEVAEEAWHAYRGPLRDFLKGLVQLAVSLHHHCAGNRHGAEVKWKSSREYLRSYEPECLGLDVTHLLGEVARLYETEPPGEPKEDTIGLRLP